MLEGFTDQGHDRGSDICCSSLGSISREFLMSLWTIRDEFDLLLSKFESCRASSCFSSRLNLSS